MDEVIDQELTGNYAIYHSDCVSGMEGIPDNSIGYSIYSPPFEALYTFSNSDRDMSNCADSAEFWDHYRFLIQEHMRTMMPGRLVSVHCINLPTTKSHDGFIGIRDFRGEIIRAFEKAGFIHHSEVVIWKDPVVSMQRTKAIGLLHKQLKKDSAMSRQGIPDYIVTFRKPGDNPEAIEGRLQRTEYAGENMPPEPRVGYTDDQNRYVERTPDQLADWESIEVWQRYASPVWFDIRQGNVLKDYRNGKDADDGKHITPLQLDVIERCLQLWSNPGDTVLTPFMGIGSEVYTAVKMGRKAIGFELKESYWNVAKKNAALAVEERDAPTLFDHTMEETA